MNITATVPDAISLVWLLGCLCLLIAIVGCVFTLVAIACVLGFPDEEPGTSAAQPPVTVLKPLHDVEPGLPARLAAFCRQDYHAPVQILCGTPDRDLPSTALVRATEAAYPDLVELVADPRRHGANRKVSNLLNMLPRARHDTLVLSDSDIVVGPGYLSGLAAALSSPKVGAVSCLYYGIGGEGLWTRMSALAINLQFLPQAVTAVSLGLAKPCCGATIALRRSTLDRIGGFGALADVLADDYAIGVAVRSAGYDVVTAPFLVGHQCFEFEPAAARPAPDPRRAHHQEHRSGRLCRHHCHPPLAAGVARPAFRQFGLGYGSDRGPAVPGDAVRLRRVALRIAAAKLLAGSGTRRHRICGVCEELLRGDGALARRRLPCDGGRIPGRRPGPARVIKRKPLSLCALPAGRQRGVFCNGFRRQRREPAH